MVNFIMAMKAYYISLAAFLFIGIVSSFAEWNSMRRLLKASRNVKEA